MDRREALYGIKDTMREIQMLTERLAGYVLDLEANGEEFPAMKQTARLLAEIALGWQAGEA